MSLTLQQQFVLSGLPVAKIMLITEPDASKTPAVNFAITPRYEFNNLKKVELKLPKSSSSSSSSSDNITVVYADNTTVQFPKKSVTIDGDTEQVVTAAASTSGDASGKGDITLELNGAPLKPVGMRPTMFADEMYNKYADSKWISILPLGVTREQLLNGMHPDSYAFVVMSLNGDITLINDANVNPTSYVYAAQKVPTIASILAGSDSTAIAGVQTVIDAILGGSIDVTQGGGKKYTVLFPDMSILTDDEIKKLMGGEPVIVPTKIDNGVVKRYSL